MSKTHEKTTDGFRRTEEYYDNSMRLLCGPGYKDLLRVQHRQLVRSKLKKPKKELAVTLLISGSPQEVNCFRAEAFYVALRNGLSCIRADDSLLVKLNFNEIDHIPDTAIENVVELETPEFVWLDICTTKNSFIPYQIMRLIDRREQQGKWTVLYSPDRDSKVWQAQYESSAFIKYLQALDHFNVERFK